MKKACPAFFPRLLGLVELGKETSSTIIAFDTPASGFGNSLDEHGTQNDRFVLTQSNSIFIVSSNHVMGSKLTAYMPPAQRIEYRIPSNEEPRPDSSRRWYE